MRWTGSVFSGKEVQFVRVGDQQSVKTAIKFGVP